MTTPKPPRPTPLNAPAAWLATGLGLTVGIRSPGTVGALWGVPIWLAVSQAPGAALQWTVLVGLVLVGVPLCHQAARDLVRLGLAAHTKDPQAITWDEFTTVAVVYAFAPSASVHVVWLAIGFALHRLFDITKFWPCQQLERLPGGLGVMADDVAASVYAGVCYAMLWRWWNL